jgi:tripartite-type tricarboxylate transporter receptor subunit TctC
MSVEQREKNNKKARDWYKENSDKAKAHTQKWRESNPDKIKEHKKIWMQKPENRVKHILTQAKRRAKFKNMPFDPDRDILPVAMLAQSPLILLINNSVPAQNFPDFLKWVKSNSGKLSYSSAGIGTTGHLGMELLKQMAGVDILHVPYKGTAAATTDLISGQVQMTFDNTTNAFPHMRSGAVRGIAVGQKLRIDSNPDLPTIHEAGVPNFEVIPWFALGTRTGVSKEIVDRVHACATASITKPENQKRLANAGIIPQPMSQLALASFVQVEASRWGDIVRKSGANAD